MKECSVVPKSDEDVDEPEFEDAELDENADAVDAVPEDAEVEPDWDVAELVRSEINVVKSVSSC